MCLKIILLWMFTISGCCHKSTWHICFSGSHYLTGNHNDAMMFFAALSEHRLSSKGTENNQRYHLSILVSKRWFSKLCFYVLSSQSCTKVLQFSNSFTNHYSINVKHRGGITEPFELERILKGHLVQLLCKDVDRSGNNPTFTPSHS